MTFEELVASVIQQESGGNPNAVSPVGAAGLMQVMPATAADPGFGVTPLNWEQRFDPVANQRFGEQYLQAMLDRYDGDTTRALVAYNWGAGNADRWSGNIADLPAETQGYVANITGGNVPHTASVTPQAATAPATAPSIAIEPPQSPYAALGEALTQQPQAAPMQPMQRPQAAPIQRDDRLAQVMANYQNLMKQRKALI